jgi:hypothetical protein
MGTLPDVLGFRTLRRTVQVCLGCKILRVPGTRRKRLRCAWYAHLHSLVTSIHETSGLIGTTITLPSPEIAEILCLSGFDWLFVDSEMAPKTSRFY